VELRYGGPIEHLCRGTGWRALDCTTGEFLDLAADPGAGFRQWQAFRDQVVATHRARGADVVVDVALPGARIDAIVSSRAPSKRWWEFWK
jgi:hypothetical protein